MLISLGTHLHILDNARIDWMTVPCNVFDWSGCCADIYVAFVPQGYSSGSCRAEASEPGVVRWLERRSLEP